MATTRIMSIHAKAGMSLQSALGITTDYVENPDKTDDKKYLSSYMCDPETVTEEFVFTRQMYDRNHSFFQRKNDVIAYQIRQSFAPGEIDPDTANKLGYELAMRITKGKHQFIVATHVDKKHIHNHIIYNSVTVDSSRKFRDFLGSGRAVRKVNDIICLENDLSVIKNPKLGNHNYGKWLGNQKKPSNRDYLRVAIDDALQAKPKSFDELMKLLRDRYNIEVDTSGKHIKLRGEGQKQFSRLKSLGEGYSKEDLEKRIAGDKTAHKKTLGMEYEELGGRRVKVLNSDKLLNEDKISLLIDLQKIISEGKGTGYERWAKQFNLKQTAKTLSYLNDLGISSYKELKASHNSLHEKYESLRLKIRELDTQMEEIRTLQGAIITYIKTNESYQKYKKSGYSKKLKEKLANDIRDHEEARKHFKKYEGSKVPTIKELKAEYAALKEEKSEMYKDYQKTKKDYTELAIAKKNIDIILDRDHDGTHDFLEKDDPEHSH
nr:relaxase/mobilization nuclease domain-containing protein [uncultured Butyrivibrio sp.]